MCARGCVCVWARARRYNDVSFSLFVGLTVANGETNKECFSRVKKKNQTYSIKLENINYCDFVEMPVNLNPRIFRIEIMNNSFTIFFSYICRAFFVCVWFFF